MTCDLCQREQPLTFHHLIPVCLHKNKWFKKNYTREPKDQIQLFAKFFKLDKRQLIKEVLSDQFAYKIIEEEADLDTLRAAEDKIRYLIKQKG